MMTTEKFDINNKPSGLTRIYLASVNSTRAFSWLYKNETAFKQELLLLGLLIPVSFFFDVSAIEHGVLVISLIFIVFTEVVNTAIEVVVDRIGLEIHPLSGLAKDLGSAAVLLSLVIAIITWCAILWPL
ncbi:MAG: diacylglycerol kinase (ATP) [Alteromonadaceae bacterium]|jgi:diacylglycerol kinase (ATP)